MRRGFGPQAVAGRGAGGDLGEKAGAPRFVVFRRGLCETLRTKRFQCKVLVPAFVVHWFLRKLYARTLRLRGGGIAMAVQKKIGYASLAQLHLDADNPRLGRENTNRELSEPKILELMKDWTLEELAL